MIIRILIIFLLLSVKANAFISISSTIFTQDHKNYITPNFENSLSINLSYPIKLKSFLVIISTNRLTNSFLRQEGVLIDKSTSYSLITKTRLLTDSMGVFKLFQSYLIGANIINAIKDTKLYQIETFVSRQKISELLYGFSFGKILDNGVLTATYIFKSQDFNLKRAINISYAFKF